jgi:esterase/lipase superfamily enzyme
MKSSLISILNRYKKIFSTSFVVLFLLSGCAEPTTVLLMPAPVIYYNAEIDPYSHLKKEEKTTSIPVIFATNREFQESSANTPYGNGISDFLHLGEVQVMFGNHLTSWEELHLASIQPVRTKPIALSIESTNEIAKIKTKEFNMKTLPDTTLLKEFTGRINHHLAQARDKEIIIYVHGAKGSFLKSVALTAELDHFTGRDFLGIAFSWPSHQNIVSYLFGIDIQRAIHSTTSLRTLIELLAKYTNVKHINIICYSAGGKLVSQALYELYEKNQQLNSYKLKEKFRLGTILFTASDVSIDTFLEKLPAISEMARQVVVTVSDNDQVLHYAEMFMGGSDRIGTRQAEKSEENFIFNKKINNFEIIDFSFGKEERGFDITGHHYWHKHPWASSDIIFLLRTDLPGKYRGLMSTGTENVWYLSSDYPEAVKDAAKSALKGQW